jgi:hypothetical protein
MTPEVETLKRRLTIHLAKLKEDVEDKRLEVYLCERERRELMMGKKPSVIRAILKVHDIALG